VLGYAEKPEEEACLGRLTERRIGREKFLERRKAISQELTQLAPQGLMLLQAEHDESDRQRLQLLERRPELAKAPSEEELRERERAAKADAAELKKFVQAREEEVRQAGRNLERAEGFFHQSDTAWVEATASARNHRENLQHLGDEITLQAARDHAEADRLAAQERLDAARLTEAESTVDQRCQDAENAVKLREERLQDLERELAMLRGRLLGSEGLHNRLADAEAALREAEEDLARGKLEAEAHKRLHDLFEACRENQVQQVMGPVGERVLNWAHKLGLNEYREFRFGDRFLPEGLVLGETPSAEAIALDTESYGTNEQLGLLVRLALGGVLAHEEPAVAILDDPLAHADPAKHRRILDLVRLAAEGDPSWNPPAGKLQILILTCHPERFDHLTGVHQIDLGKLIEREG
jgi:hypothetical protein